MSDTRAPLLAGKLSRSGNTGTRRLLALARPHLFRLGIGTLCLAIGSAASLAYPATVRYLVDEALGKGDASALNRLTLALLFVLIIQAFAIAARFYLFTTTGERIVADLRTKVFSHLLTQEPAFFDQNKTGELVSRLASDATVLQNAVSVNISMALRNLVSAVFGTAMLFWTSWRLAIVMMLVVPPIAIFAARFARKTRGLARETQDAVAQASSTAEESLSNVKTVLAFSGAEQEQKHYGAAIERSFQTARKRIRLSSTFVGTTSLLGYAMASLVLWYGGHLVLTHSLSIGALTSFLMYTMIVAFAFGAVTDLYADFARADGASARIFALLDRTSELVSGDSDARSGKEDAPIVRFRDVTFAYPTRPETNTLRAVSFHVARGERVALVGPSGAGKSTVASLILRFYDPAQGGIEFMGQDLRSLDVLSLRREIAVVSQEPTLFATSILENIRYGKPEATDAEVIDAAKGAYAHEFVSSFPQGYQTLVGERGTQLSGGQKQRVAIARALLRNPSLLILDEATSALDTESEQHVKSALEALMRGRSTLIIAHRLSTVEDADRILVFEQGQLVEEGSHGQLREQNGVYRRLVMGQIHA